MGRAHLRNLLPTELLVEASEKFADLCPELVFLGGAVVDLLVTEHGGLPPRGTNDVDVAIGPIGTFLDVYGIDHRLLSLGFRNDTEGPTCRYLHGSAVVDVIPVNAESPGDVNSWYPLAIETAQQHVLPNGIQISVISAACFLGTKLVAFRSSTREYHDDIFLSRDFADIIRVVDGRPTIATEVLEAREDLRIYLQSQFEALLNMDLVEYAIGEHIDPGREEIVFERIRAFLP